MEPVEDRSRVEELTERLRANEAALGGAAGERQQRAWLDSVSSAQKRVEKLSGEIELVRAELGKVRDVESEGRATEEAVAAPRALDSASSPLDHALRGGVLALLAGLLGLMIWAAVLDYPLRVTSDTPTYIALVSGMAERPFEEQSPFLVNGPGTQHATPYIQSIAFLWSFLAGHAREPVEMARLLGLVGIPVFALTLFAVFAYTRRLAGSRAGWLAIPILLGIFGPPHVIWASDLSLHAALYASFFPQNLAIALALLTLLALGRNGYVSLVLACLGAAATMLVHPFTGALLCVLATAWSCHLAIRRKRAFVRAPIALAAGLALGALWPAYSLDLALSETGLRGVFLVALCGAVPLVFYGLTRLRFSRTGRSAAIRALDWLEAPRTAWRLALVGAAGTAIVALWESRLVHAPPTESARLAIYWVDDRWRWPLLLVAGTVGVSGLATLARRGNIVPAVWFSGCLGLGLLGALGVPLPVWYRFLLLCQIPLAIGVAVVVSRAGRTRTTAVIAATFCLAVGLKVVTLLDSSARVTYFGSPPQTVWSLGTYIPPGPGIVATDPSTAYYVPAATGRRVLTVGKGHVSSQRELKVAEDGYRLLRRYYAGGRDWWQAGQEMWRRGVRYVIVEKNTTLEPKTLSDFIWQTAALRTPAQRRALGNYYYENNRVGRLVHDSPEYAVYRLDRRKLFGPRKNSEARR